MNLYMRLTDLKEKFFRHYNRYKIIKNIFSYPASPKIMTFKRYFFLVLILYKYKIFLINNKIKLFIYFFK